MSESINISHCGCVVETTRHCIILILDNYLSLVDRWRQFAGIPFAFMEQVILTNRGVRVSLRIEIFRRGIQCSTYILLNMDNLILT
jgi:hypothetical protein